MSDASYRQLLKAAKAQGRDTDIPSVAVAATLLPGFDPDDDATLLQPSILLTPCPHPLLEAYLETTGATRRGRMSWAVGLGEDYTGAPLNAVLTRLAAGTIYAEGQTTSTRGPRKFEDIRGWDKANALRNELRGSAAMVPNTLLDTPRINSLHPGHGAARFGAMTVSIGHNVLWLKVITGPFDAPEGLPQIPLNLRPAGKSMIDAKPVRPVDAIQVLDWLNEEGVTIVDPDPANPIARIRQRVSRSVIAIPAPGRPAIADVSVGRRVKTRRVDLPDAVLDHASSVSTRMSALDVIALTRTMEPGTAILHPGTADIGHMAHAQAYTGDERLYGYQSEAVGVHLSTRLGYLLCCEPGMGKTVVTYSAIRERSKTRHRYRALVTAEAQLRAQWPTEAETWFPEAVVFPVESRADAPRLAQVLAETDGPVVIVLSYGLLASVNEELAKRAAIEEIDEARIDEVIEALLSPQPVAVQPAPPAAGIPGELIVTYDDEFTGQLDLFSMFADLPATVPAAQVHNLDEQETTISVDQEPLWPSLGALLLDTFFHDIIADEAEVLRGTGTKQSIALWQLRANSEVATALTGTPINKGVDDLGRLISWIRNDQFLFHGVRLSTQFDLDDDESLAEFWAAMGPLIFRRDTSEISDDLPEIVPTIVRLTPSADEKALTHAAQNELKRVYSELLAALEIVEETDPDNPDFASAREALQAARGAWLGGTTLARMASSDPAALLDSTSAGAALLAGQGLIEAANARPGTKRQWVVAATAERVAAGKQVLVFSEFATVARALIADMDAAGLRVGEVLGGGGSKRDRMIAAFQRGELDVLVATSSGERGLNLQQAAVIIHHDLPWTPKAVIQRTGRAIRIGSKNQHVEVIFPLMEDAISQRVAALVVSRAVEAMRALDASRGVDVSKTEMGLALGGLAAELQQMNPDGTAGAGSDLWQMTQALVA